jgi:hypothetical protein
VSSAKERPELFDEKDGFGLSWTGRLEWPEKSLIRHAVTGEIRDLGHGSAPGKDQAPLGLEEMQAWGADRTIRAEVLRHLLVESEWPVHVKGVWLRGARITGPLDLESATLRCPLVLEDCYFESEQPVVVDYATVARLCLVRCRLAGLTADTVVVNKEVDLTRSTFSGAVSLISANIDSQLICRGATITGTGTDGCALVADSVKVGGGMFLDGGFTAAGAVRLLGADITGQLSCRGATITGTGTGTDTDGCALVADSVKVGGGMFLDGGFTAAGAVRLLGADITGQLSCRGATITGTGTGTGTETDGCALVADGVKVGGNMFLDGGFTAAGAVRLLGADITGQLSCRGATITGTDGCALVADGVKVDGNVFLDKGFTSYGALRLPGADITGDLTCSDVKITGTSTDGWGALCLVGAHVGGGIRLDAAAIRDPSGGPGELALDGLVYAGLPQQPQAKEWLDLLRERTARYSPQPYRQLAAASQAAGHDALTRRILVAQRKDQLRRGQTTWGERFWGKVTHVTLGYGYRPWLALVWLLGIVSLAVILNVSFGAHGGLAHTKTSTSPGTSCSTLERVGVGLDFAIPVVKSGAGGTCATTQTVAGNTITITGWVLQLAAWSLATLFVAGFTGAVRKT